MIIRGCMGFKCDEQRTWTIRHSTRLPIPLAEMDFGGLSRERRSTTKRFPPSVPIYIDAPSGEKTSDVIRVFTSTILKSLGYQGQHSCAREQSDPYPLSFSRSTRCTVPPSHAADTRVLLYGLHASETTSPLALLPRGMVLTGLEGLFTS